MDPANPKPKRPPKPSLVRNIASNETPTGTPKGTPKGTLQPPIVISEPSPKKPPPKPKFSRESSSSSTTPEPSAPLPPVSRSTTPRPPVSRTTSPLPATPPAPPTLNVDGYRPPVPAPRSPMLLIESDTYLDPSASPETSRSPMLSTGAKAFEWAPPRPEGDEHVQEHVQKLQEAINQAHEDEYPDEYPKAHVPAPFLAPTLPPRTTILERSKSIVLKEKALKSSEIDHNPPKTTLSFPFPDIKGVFPINEQCNLICTQSSITLVADDLQPIWQSQDYEICCCVAENDRIWVGMPSGLVACLDLVQGHTLFLSRTAHTKPVFDIWFDETQNAAISLGQDGKALVWHNFDDPPTIFRTVPTQINGALYHMGKLYVATKTSLYVYDPFGPTLYLTPRPVELPLESSSSTRKYFNCIQTDGLTLICGHNDGSLSTFDLNTFQPIFTYRTGIHAINCIAAVNGMWWLGLSSGSILVVDPHESLILKEWKSGTSPVKYLASIHLTGALVVAVDGSGAQLWDAETNIASLPKPKTSKKPKSDSVRIFSWNVDSRNPETMAPELVRNNCMDAETLIFGLQEVVELSNKTKTAKKIASGGDQTEHKEYGLWKRYFAQCLGQGYDIIYDKALVGLYLVVFSKSASINVNECALVKTGMGGLHGNKGAISLSLDLEGTSICLINCHLAAGHTQIIQRNRDAAQILDTPVGSLKPLEHDCVFFFGDTNYRINTARELAVKYIKDGAYDRLSQLDQLNGQKRKNPTFVLNALHEANLGFPPTYKFDRNSDRYDTSEKKRIPAWCDRILYRGNVQPLDYTSISCQYSDHRPVTGRFDIQV